MFSVGSASAQSVLSSVMTTSLRLPISSVPQPMSQKNSAARPCNSAKPTESASPPREASHSRNDENTASPPA